MSAADGGTGAAGVDRRAVVAGAGVALAFALPVAIGAQVIDAVWGLHDDGLLPVLFFVVVLAGLVIGGRHAARRRPDLPYMHGALAGLGAYAVIAGVSVGRFLAAGEAIPVLSFVFNGMLAASFGLLGGFLALREADRRHREADGGSPQP